MYAQAQRHTLAVGNITTVIPTLKTEEWLIFDVQNLPRYTSYFLSQAEYIVFIPQNYLS
jgi:hypothetical protein